jgi:hypothetical protein
MRPLARRGTRLLGLTLVLLVLFAAGIVRAEPDPADLRTAKALFFDKKYAEARGAWAELRSAGGPGSDAALFWIARCSEGLGEHERALREYGEFLAENPAERTLADEARTSRISLATRLYKAGKREHLPIVRQALGDSSATVRYFAAFQLASLGPEVGQAAVPVLRKIVAQERDEDLVERAKLGLLRVDPQSLAGVAEPSSRKRVEAEPSKRKEAAWIRVRFYEKGGEGAKVSINLPMALAELVYKSLPDSARDELRKEGYDADTFWERLKELGPTEVIEVVGSDGGKLRIWIE